MKDLLALFWEKLPSQWKAAIGIAVLASQLVYWGYHFSVWTEEQFNKMFDARAAQVLDGQNSQIGEIKTEITGLRTEIRALKTDTTIIKNALIKR